MAELDLDTMTEKPWDQPGADVTDYFNYGFTEATWRAYCQKQQTMRQFFGAQVKVLIKHLECIILEFLISH